MIRRSRSWRLGAPFRASPLALFRFRRAILPGAPTNPLFDSTYYLEKYPDVRETGLDPYEHYLRFGAAEGRDPNPMCDSV